MFHVPNKDRIKSGTFASDDTFGNNGMFVFSKELTTYFIIASDGGGWEHVSVHCVINGKECTPSWDDMCFIKSIFWDEDDCIVQYHPAKSEYVNMHKHTLHLWKQINDVFPIPNKNMIGF